MNPDRSLSLILKLPHKPPMRMVQEVLNADSSGATCSLTADGSFCERWGGKDFAYPYFSIEFAAQTAAIAIGCEDDEMQQQSGMLVQVREYQAMVETVPAGSKLLCRANVDVGLGGSFAMAKCSVTCDEVIVCEVQLSIAISE